MREILFLIIPFGIIGSLVAFFVFELQALKAKRAKEKAGVVKSSIADVYYKFELYETPKNTLYFFIASYILTFVIATVAHDPNYGLADALLYIFLTTFIGSIFVLLFKAKHSIMVKVFAAFLYGAPHIFAASLAFLTKYIVS